MVALIQTYPILSLITIGFLLGSLPLIGWLTYGATGKRLRQMGTRNVSVSAAFAHGGTTVGVMAVGLEMFRGIAMVLLARSLFPNEPAWELLALIPIVLGRFFSHRGAGVTNVVWGYVVHDWRIAFFVGTLGGILFTIIRAKATSRWLILLLTPIITVLLYPYDTGELTACILLCLVIAMIYSQIPDDLDLADSTVKPESRRMLGFFRGDRAFPSLKQSLKVHQVGQKSATLALLKQWGYPVPMGWVIQPGDDPEGLIQSLQLSDDRPVIVRSSAIGEDSEEASAAGQYESIPNITTPCALRQAILYCQQSYGRSTAVSYRRDRQLPDTGMAVLVQRQIKGTFSGVAFSRDPITRQGDAVLVEALPGDASQVVSGRQTPDEYRVWIPEDGITNGTAQDSTGKTAAAAPTEQQAHWRIPDEQTFPMEGEGNIPPRLIQHVAYLVRHIEQQYHGIPQDMEWSYDGHSLWVLQSRPITTLLPIWTRKIAAEVIPGHLHPLTWSINHPLTCGVWGEIFAVVLGEQAQGFDFQHTATLHHSVAYFNASLLGQIFRCMGLPEDSLEFLTRGAKFQRPPIRTLLKQLPGLFRLMGREWSLAQDFERDRPSFESTLNTLAQDDLQQHSASDLWARTIQIQDLLKRVTYYSIMAPLSAAIRQAVGRVPETAIHSHQLPEVASLRAIQALAADITLLWQEESLTLPSPDTLKSWADLETVLHRPDVQAHLGSGGIDQRLEEMLEQYGYLSDVATNVAVPTWKEDPSPIHGLILQSIKRPPQPQQSKPGRSPGARFGVQARVNLKGHVAVIYNRLLAELRWTLVALESKWLRSGRLQQADDLFFLTMDEIEALLAAETDPATPTAQQSGPQSGPQSEQRPGQRPGQSTPLSAPRPKASDAIAALAPEVLAATIEQRRSQLDQDRRQSPPYLVYGNTPARTVALPPQGAGDEYQGIGASPGQISGPIVPLTALTERSSLEPGTIVVVPYTDAGWAPLLTQASGIIAEVGGRLSHGAIIAREYGIPAVMNIPNIMQYLRTGQVVYLDGTNGRVTILHDKLNSNS